MVETGVGTLESDPGFDWAYSRAVVLDGNGTVLRRFPEAVLVPYERPPEGNMFSSLFIDHENFIPVNAIMIRRKVIDVGMFDESLTSYEDWDFWLRVSVKYEVKYINKLLAFVRFRPDSMHRNAVRFYSNEARVIRKICNLYPHLINHRRRELCRRLAGIHDQVGMEYFDRGQFARSTFEFSRSITAYPFRRRSYLNLVTVLLNAIGIRGFKPRC
jgi:hypothetical protein